MPGVPSGRGCDACRKQKKKCDQVQPSCSRCTRLDIPCNGNGQRRFKFIKEDQSLVVKSKAASTSTDHESATARWFHYLEISWAPSNNSTMMTGAFCSALGIEDVRYDLSVFGTFLKDIPKRLGTSNALDASVKTLTLAYSDLQSPSRYRSVQAYEAYGLALKTLRRSLSNPAEASSTNTMCAVYLMLVCQGWLGGKGDRPGHCEALAYLLNIAASQNGHDDFETELTITLCVPVITEAIANPRINLHPWVEKLTLHHDKTIPIESLKMQHLARLPDFINFPHLYIAEIRATYHQMRTDSPTIHKLLLTAAQNQMATLHSRYQTLYGIQLGVGSVLNTILSAFEPENLTLVDESVILVDEMLKLAEDALEYRPLGAGGMPVCLICAWSATDDPVKRARMKELFLEYSTGFPVAAWLEVALWVENNIKAHSLAQSPRHQSASGTELIWLQDRPELSPDVPSSCCMM